MSGSRATAPDPGLISAATQGDPQAVDEVAARAAPLVYNIVGRAMPAHAEIDDVVRAALTRVMRRLPRLEEPAQWRPWVAAETLEEVRAWRRRRRPWSPPRRGDRVQPCVDFVDQTIAQLGLEGRLREVAEATRWLDSGDAQLLALWWLEAIGELTRDDLAAALRLSPTEASARVERLRSELFTAAAVVRALQPAPECPGLTKQVRSWDGRPSSHWRGRFAQHLHGCPTCRVALVIGLPLLTGLELVPIPATLDLGSTAPQAPLRPARPHVSVPVEAHGPNRDPVLGRASTTVAGHDGDRAARIAALLSATILVLTSCGLAVLARGPWPWSTSERVAAAPIVDSPRSSSTAAGSQSLHAGPVSTPQGGGSVSPSQESGSATSSGSATPSGSATSSASGPAQSARTSTYPLQSTQEGWTATGIVLGTGDSVNLVSSGTYYWNVNPNEATPDPTHLRTPNGAACPVYGTEVDSLWLAGNRLPCFAVVAKIGPNGNPFFVGTSWGGRVSSSGHLFVGINILRGGWSSTNRGALTVQVTAR